MIDHETSLDEALSALLDGALPREQAEALQRRMQSEPELAARYRALRDADGAVRDAYASIVDEPLPSGVLKLLERPVERAAPVSVVPAARRRKVALRIPLAAAATIAFVAGVSTVFLFDLTRTQATLPIIAEAGAVAADSPLYTVLQEVPSGESRAVSAGVSALPRLTFQSESGSYCRRVDLATEQGGAQLLACRRDGAWQIEVAGFVPGARLDDGVYRPATAESIAAVETAIDELIADAPLGREEERALLSSGWTTGTPDGE